jgi:hypothetical protein
MLRYAGMFVTDPSRNEVMFGNRLKRRYLSCFAPQWEAN